MTRRFCENNQGRHALAVTLQWVQDPSSDFGITSAAVSASEPHTAVVVA